MDGIELKVRDFEETKVDGQSRLITHDLKRQKVDGLKSTLHTIGPLTFELKTVIYRRIYRRDFNRPYSLLETQFKSRPCTLEWTVSSQIYC